MNHFSRLTLLGLTLALASCSVLQTDKVDYKSAGKAPSLDVPPDLTQLSRDNRYNIPGSTVTASGYQVGQVTQTAPTAVATMGDVRIERAGNQRWLVVNQPAEQIWEPVKDFWQESGFFLSMDQASLGIMETDWAENRAKLPQDFIRSTIGKAFDSLYSTGERDRFRTRLERTGSATTEIFISHRGMVEVYSNTQKDQTVWQPRPSDAELEAEFLRRLMVKLGVSQEQSKALVATSVPKAGSRLASVDGQSVVQMDDAFDRAWRRVGLSLDRTGFTVEDRDRAQGTYFVRYVEPTVGKSEPGFFGKLFGSSATESAPAKFRITVRGQGESSTVAVLNASGAPDSSSNAQRILKVIADDLK